MSRICNYSKNIRNSTQNKAQQQRTHTSIGQNSILFVNNCVGDVLLTIGARFSHIGLPCGIFLLTITYLYQIFGFVIITKACQYCASTSLFDLFKKAYSHHFAMFIDVCAVIMLYIVLICYTIIISQYVHQAYQFFFKVGDCLKDDTVCIQHYNTIELYIRLVVGFILLPLESLITSMKILNVVSSISILFVLFTLIAIVIRFAQTMITGKLPGDKNSQYQLPQPRIPLKSNIFSIFLDWTGMFAMFSLQPIIPPLYNDLGGNNKIKKYVLINSIVISASILFIMYMICGIIGCLMFYGQNQHYYQSDNILVNFAATDILMTVVRIIYIFVVALGYPVIVYQIRASIASWLHIEKNTCCQKTELILIGVITSFISSSVSVFTPSILIIFDPFCCIFGAILFQILPLLVWYKLPQLYQYYYKPDQYADFDLDKKLRRSSIFQATANIMTHRSLSFGLETLSKEITESMIQQKSMQGSRRLSLSLSHKQNSQKEESDSSIEVINYSHYVPAFETINEIEQETGLVSNQDATKKQSSSLDSETLNESDLEMQTTEKPIKFLNEKARMTILIMLLVLIAGYNGISLYVSIKNIIKQKK